VQIASAHFDHLFEQLAQRNSRHLRTLSCPGIREYEP
jgi:hypothetical protein